MTDFRADHPVGPSIQASRLWFGPEVEGVHLGLPTAFIAGRLSQAEVLTLLSSGVRQWFFTEMFTSWAWYMAELRPYAPGLVTAAVLSIKAPEILALRQRLLPEIKVVVRVFNAPWAQLLGPGDQVSVGEPYHMVTFLRSAGVPTTPDQYVKDHVKDSV